jgi:hypothetical protein
MPKIAVCRKPFVHNGEQYLPGDEVPDWQEWPRPDHSLHVGLIVLKDVEPVVGIEKVLVTRKPVTRKPKEG